MCIRDRVKPQLVQEFVDGQTYWMSQSMPTLEKNLSSAYLLPGFDEYLLGYRDRSAVLDQIHNNKINPGSNGIFNPTIVVDSQIVGIWKRTFRNGVVTIAPSPFTSLSEATRRGIAAAAERYGRFVGMPITSS